LENGVSKTIEHIYDALLDDDAFARLGAAFARLLGASSGWFPIVDTQTGEAGTLAPFNIHKGAVQPYLDYYHRLDPWLAAGMVVAPDRAFVADDHITSTPPAKAALREDGWVARLRS
jgi:hypothetical protein